MTRWLILLLLTACGTTATTEKETANEEMSSTLSTDTGRDPVKDALKEVDSSDTSFYLSTNLEPFFFSATNQASAGLQTNNGKARELAPKIATMTQKAVHPYVFETLLAVLNISGAAYEDLSDAAAAFYGWQLQRKKPGPQSFTSHIQLALGAMRLKRFSLAQYHLDQAAKFTKQAIPGEIENVQGMIAIKQDRLDEALQFWREAVKRNPQHVGARLNLGTTALVLGDFQTADMYLGNLSHEAAQQAMVAANRMAEVPAKADALCRRLLQKKNVAKPVVYNCALNTWQGLDQGSVARRELQQLAQAQQMPPLLETKIFSSLEKIEDWERKPKTRPSAPSSKKVNPRSGKKTNR